VEPRYNFTSIREDLASKMVFVSGPRQVGKTTLAKSLVAKPAYLNWDIPEHREKILRRQFPPNEPFWALDEIHKFSAWRNLLKGLFDAHHGSTEILVTGSAKLDFYRRSGDSLQGRYFSHRLHPFSWKEIAGKSKQDLEDLFQFGGFPEPFFKGSTSFSKRWSRDYRFRLIREELVSLEQVSDLGKIELLSLLLPERVGSPLSQASLARDISVSPKTAMSWLNIFERLYSIFFLSPYQKETIRSVRKEKKHYHWDWTLVPSPPQRFENMVASHLLKYVHYIQDTQGEELTLHYFRDSDGREVDFVLADKSRIKWAIEVKWKEEEIHKPLLYFKRKFPEAETWQVHLEGTKNYISGEGIRVAPVRELFQKLV